MLLLFDTIMQQDNRYFSQRLCFIGIAYLSYCEVNYFYRYFKIASSLSAAMLCCGSNRQCRCKRISPGQKSMTLVRAICRTATGSRRFTIMLFHGLLDGNGDSDGSADHRVVAHAEEAHHLDVRRYRRRTCELSVRVHTSHSIGHTV